MRINQKMKHRTFLTFAILPQQPNQVKVFTDFSGDFEYLGSIEIDDYDRIINFHNLIIDSNESEEEKLRKLIDIWLNYTTIAGYLIGDLPENNIE